MKELVDIAALNSRIKFDKTDVPFDERQILGDATETGLTRFAGRHLPDYDAHQKKYPKKFEVPFNSTNKWALVIVCPSGFCAHRSLTLSVLQLDKSHSTGALTSYIKGAPERVLAKCSTYLKDGEALPMTDEFRKTYDEAYNVSRSWLFNASIR
jgi:sodium/potassium-transporting ATPase subunit alpha